jgi:hypothetical protein
MHSQIKEKLRFFAYDHLPPRLQEISKPFGELAQLIAEQCEGSQATLALQKLIESKDCAVRAKL